MQHESYNCECNCYKELNINQKGCYNDKFTLGIKSPFRCKIIGFDEKVCVLSYHMTKDCQGPILCIYGIIITRVEYYIEKECKKSYHVFITSFCKGICFTDYNTKVNSVTASIENKFYKKLDDNTILGFFTLDFCVRISVPIVMSDNECEPKNLCNIQCCDTININKDCNYCFKDEHTCCDNKVQKDEYQFASCQDGNSLKNDWMKYIVSNNYSNRL